MTLAELYARANALAGQRFADIAAAHQLPVPADLRRNKGWVGQLLETALGASAGSAQLQDFPQLGVELKTIPLDHRGEPLETTFVCSAPLTDIAQLSWEHSNVRNKLQCVLWVPIDGRRSVPVAERTVGSAFFWQPSAAEEAQLKADWQEHMDRIALGQVEQIRAQQGEVLQLRPKAAHGRVLTAAIGPYGQAIETLPRGFYLRKEFTRALLQQAFPSAAANSAE